MTNRSLDDKLETALKHVNGSDNFSMEATFVIHKLVSALKLCIKQRNDFIQRDGHLYQHSIDWEDYVACSKEMSDSEILAALEGADGE